MSNENSIYSKPILFAVVAFVVIMVGTVVTTLYPLLRSEMHPSMAGTEYTALELAGRDIYQREGCITCHSQNVRALKADVMRYGDYSKAGESELERPFLWGSRRTGPDLARIGGKYSDEWHLQHFVTPKALVPGSIMPAYPWLAERQLNVAQIEKNAKLFSKGAAVDTSALAGATELTALTAYMQKLGREVSAAYEYPIVITMQDAAEFAGKGDVNVGRSIFAAECAGCHGADGKGNISVMDFTDYEVSDFTFMVVANGMPGMMPHFIQVMTKEEVASVVQYIKTLSN